MIHSLLTTPVDIDTARAVARRQASSYSSIAHPVSPEVADQQNMPSECVLSSRDGLEAAKNALEAAAQLEPPGRAGRLEHRFVDLADQAMGNGDAFKTLLEGVNTLIHTLPPLVRALDAVAQIHPFLAIAIGAFKVVIELEVIRQDNDKKVNLLFLEMRNMMSALLQLDGVRTNHVGRDGLTISMRLKDLVAKTAKDIKDCANACDAYARKRLLVKVLKSHGWDEKLKEYIQLFSDRKTEFTFAISIHTGIGVDQANDKLDTLILKTDLILEFFQKTISREQDALAKIVLREGGADVVLVNTTILQKLLVTEKQLEVASLPSSNVASQGLGSHGLYPQMQIRSGPGAYYFSRAAENQRSEKRPPRLHRRDTYQDWRDIYREPREDYHGRGHAPLPPSPPPRVPYAYPTLYDPYQKARDDYQDRGHAPPRTQYTYATPYAPHQDRRDAYHERGYAPPRSPVAYPTAYSPGSVLGSIQEPPWISIHGVPHARPYQAESVLVDEWDAQCSQVDVARLVQDLADDPETAVLKNYVWFERKFVLQERNIIREMTRVVVYEGDRVINTVLKGPHEKILDRDIYSVWKDMRWRGLVKARHLVLALYDYYAQQVDLQNYVVTSGHGAVQSALSQRDLWALDFFKLTHLRPLMEVFDIDASGFVTVEEVNDFTTRRPKEWSLPRWLAYWTVGWQASMASYKHKIEALLAHMQTFPSSVRLRSSLANDYLMKVEPLVREMTSSFSEDSGGLPLLDHFQEYTDQEEARLREGLETVNYDLDAMDTLALIVGRWGIERNLFIILYLILRRHHDVMKAAQRAIVHAEEFPDAAAVVALVMDAVRYRVQYLKNVFYQRRLEPYRELQDYACGMLQLGPPTSVNFYRPPVSPGATVLDGVIDVFGVGGLDDKPPMAVLKYPPHTDEFYPQSDDGFDGRDGTNVSKDVEPLSGRWVVVRVQETVSTTYRDISVLHFHPSSTDAHKVIAIPLLERAWLCTRVTFTGEFSGRTKDGRPMYNISETSNATFIPDTSYKVTLDNDDSTLRGEHALAPSGPVIQVVMKKNISPEIMMFYPAPSALRKNRAADLWRFAISAVLYDIRRRLFSWAFIKERRDRKRLLTSLLYARSMNGGLHPDDQEEESQLLKLTTPADRHFYEYALLEPAKFPWLLPSCEDCGKLIRSGEPGARVCQACRSLGLRLVPGVSLRRPPRNTLRKGRRHSWCTIS
ncbi:hypothetical protein BV20DRAFT_211321 [Pilatotrama ljubarskyi]|nr:hypothetical protein BV20DRAFT_211321 [Pilatotrama ljubarskyi]